MGYAPLMGNKFPFRTDSHNMAFDRVKWLRIKLVETGHEAEQRTAWEKELADLIKDDRAQAKLKHEIIRHEPRRFQPPVKKKPSYFWNKKLMQGYQPDKVLEDRPYPHLPHGYVVRQGWIVPPYLARALHQFRHGHNVFGMTSRYEHFKNPKKNRKTRVSWASDTAKKAIKNDPEVLKTYREQLARFFKHAPCVPYYECKARFPQDALDGSCKAKDKALRAAKLAEAQRKKNEEKRKKREENRLKKREAERKKLEELPSLTGLTAAEREWVVLRMLVEKRKQQNACT